MPHNLDLYDFTLPKIDSWLSGDSRTLAFVVTDAAGNPVDISNADISWLLAERAYIDDASDAVVSGADSGVEIVTDSRVDTTQGEFEVRVDAEATENIYGEYHQRPEVEQADGTRASWSGEIVLTA